MNNNVRDTIVSEDIITLLNNSTPISDLAGNTVLITGATGLIGSFLVKLLIEYNTRSSSVITIVVLSRNIEKVREVFGDELLKGIEVLIGDVLELPPINFQIDYVVHGASITSTFDFVEYPVKTIETVVNGTQNVLELAKLKRVKSFVFLSSIEVFGFLQKSEPISENDYGYIDILNVRSSYSESKRLAECLCVSYHKELNVPVKIARLTQTVGPGIAYNDTRIAAYFSRSVIEGKDINLLTDGETTRNTIYVADAVSAILYVLLRGEPGDAYNIADKSSFLSIKETALMIANKIAKGDIKVTFQNNKNSIYAQNNALMLNMSTDKIEQLGWKAEFSLEESYRRMIICLKNTK